MFTAKKKALAASCSLACMLSFAPANAGFLNDMYDEMSANANVMGPKVYETQRSGVITGGGMVWKTPRRNFQPFNFTPPTYKSGCGGIDIFLGSFSMFSKDEFVQMLRAVGQNMAGLLFQSALAALSPELDALIRDFSKRVEEMNSKFGNSCEMAKSMNDWTSLDSMAKKFGEDARGWGVQNGIFSDRGTAEVETRGNGAKVKQNIPQKTTTTGEVISDKEMNITWNVLNTGSFASLSNADKEMLQTMLGTVIVKWTPDTDGADQYLDTRYKPALGKENIRKWIGSAQDASATVPVKIYQCDDYAVCMGVTEPTVNYTSMAKTVYSYLNELRQAIIERRVPVAVNGVNPMNIAALTSVPVGNIMNLVTSSQYRYLGDITLQNYADAIAYDITTRLMEEVIDQSEKALHQYKTGGSPAAIDMVNLKKGIVDVREEITGLRKEVSARIQEQNASVMTIMEMEKVVYGGMSRKVLSNMRFNSSN